MSDTYNFENATNFKTVKIIPLKGEKGDAGDSGDYSGLTNKPSINGVSVNGDMTASDLGLASSASIEMVVDNVYTKEETIATVVDLIYPVGSIYMSVNNVDPATFLPNTAWEKIRGKFLLASDDTMIWDTSVLPPVWRENFPLGGTGGEERHTLTVYEMPAHTHKTTLPIASVMPTSQTTTGTTSVFTEGASSDYDTDSTGTGGSHNNMPPYLTVNVWKRIA